jgi:hypothetical protein
MARPTISTKRLAIDKTNAQMVVVVAAASFITVFCLIASKAVWSQYGYQSRVTSSQETANKNLNQSIKAFGNLVTSYDAFNSSSATPVVLAKTTAATPK